MGGRDWLLQKLVSNSAGKISRELVSPLRCHNREELAGAGQGKVDPASLATHIYATAGGAHLRAPGGQTCSPCMHNKSQVDGTLQERFWSSRVGGKKL